MAQKIHPKIQKTGQTAPSAKKARTTAPHPDGGKTQQRPFLQPDSAFVGDHSRAKLLRAGLEIFSRKGLHGTTTRAIAEAAGVNEALIMRHFQTKEGLFLEVLRESKRLAFEVHYEEKKTLEDELVTYGKARLHVDYGECNLLRILVSQIVSEDKFAKMIRETLKNHLNGKLEKRLQYFRDKGSLKSTCALHELAHMIDSQIFSCFMYWYMVCRAPEAAAQKHLAQTMRILAHGLQVRI